MSNSRIPSALPEFDKYIQNANHYLNAIKPGDSLKRGQILGMTLDELGKLTDFSMKWRSNDDANPGLYDLHTDLTKKTKLTRVNVEGLMKDFSLFFRPILTRISGSAEITTQDRFDLNIAAPVTSHSFHSVPIGEQCFASAERLGGAFIKIRCHSFHDAGRPSKPALADAVEIAYRMQLPTIEPPNEHGQPGRILVSQICNVEECTHTAIYTKAAFLMKLGDENIGKFLQYYCRWINTRHPELAGTWTGPWSVIIA